MFAARESCWNHARSASGAGARTVETVLAIAALVAVCGAGVWLHRREVRKCNEVLRATAARFGGELVDAGRGTRGRIILRIDGVPGRVSTTAGGEDDRGETRIVFEWSAPGTLRIAPEGILVQIGKWFGMQDIQVGDRDFDREFLIRGDPEAWVREALDAGARRSFSVLAKAAGSPVRLDAGPAGVRIRCARDLSQAPADLDVAVRSALELLRRLRECSAGLKPMPGAAALAATGRCPVCGQDMAAPLRRCERCRTPHHADCWEYFGSCAIYACASRKALPLEKKKA